MFSGSASVLCFTIRRLRCNSVYLYVLGFVLGFVVRSMCTCTYMCMYIYMYMYMYIYMCMCMLLSCMCDYSVLLDYHAFYCGTCTCIGIFGHVHCMYMYMYMYMPVPFQVAFFAVIVFFQFLCYVLKRLLIMMHLSAWLQLKLRKCCISVCTRTLLMYSTWDQFTLFAV